MIIHYYTICWNEEMILPFVLRYYSKFCNKMVFMDNESTDSSHEIIKSFDNTEIRTFKTNNQINDAAYLDIKNNIWKESRGIADWIIICDTDEILYHSNLLFKLEMLKAKGVSIIKPYGYDMVAESFPTEDILEIKTGVKENRHFRKCIIFDPNKISEINFKTGCHKCKPEGNVKFYKKSDIKLLHYKNLGLSYLVNRFNVFKSRLSQYNIDNKFGTHYLSEKEELEKKFNKLKRKATIVVK